MRRWWIKCPYCGNEIISGSGYGDKVPAIFPPLMRCQVCGNLYKTGSNEYLTLTEQQRLYLKDNPQNARYIEQSLDRTNNKDYQAFLKKQGYELFPITELDTKTFSNVNWNIAHIESSPATIQSLYNIGVLIKPEELDIKTGGIKREIIEKRQRNYKIYKRISLFSNLVGWPVGFIFAMIFMGINPNSYLFLLGPLIGLGAGIVTYFGLLYYYEWKEKNYQRNNLEFKKPNKVLPITANNQNNVIHKQELSDEDIDICLLLHQTLWTGIEFNYKSGFDNLPSSGFYIMFEKGETAYGGKRIVRVGEAENLPMRIASHYDHPVNTSDVFRTLLSECLPESEISDYIQKNISFVVIDLQANKEIINLKNKLITTASLTRPSKNWLGLKSPNAKIKKYGLWQKNGIGQDCLNESDLKIIAKYLKRNNNSVEPNDNDDDDQDEVNKTQIEPVYVKPTSTTSTNDNNYVFTSKHFSQNNQYGNKDLKGIFGCGLGLAFILGLMFLIGGIKLNDFIGIGFGTLYLVVGLSLIIVTIGYKMRNIVYKTTKSIACGLMCIVLFTFPIPTVLMITNHDFDNNKEVQTEQIPCVITFDKQGGTGGTDTLDVNYKESLFRKDVDYPKKIGYAFKGYYTSPNGVGTQYFNEYAMSTKDWDLKENTTLYAYWLKLDSVTLDKSNFKDYFNVSSSHSSSYNTVVTPSLTTTTTLKVSYSISPKTEFFDYARSGNPDSISLKLRFRISTSHNVDSLNPSFSTTSRYVNVVLYKSNNYVSSSSQTYTATNDPSFGNSVDTTVSELDSVTIYL